MLSRLLPILLALAAAVASSPVPAAVAVVDYCAGNTSLTWTIADFKSNSTDSVGSGGTASLKLTNNLTGDTDELTCSLQVNYRCIFAGTPSDRNLTIHLGIRAESLTLGVDKTVDCPGRTTPLHIIGYGEVPLECTFAGEVVGGNFKCALDAEEDNTFSGAPVELAPGQ